MLEYVLVHLPYVGLSGDVETTLCLTTLFQRSPRFFVWLSIRYKHDIFFLSPDQRALYIRICRLAAH
jgi:hypothetical protein